MSSEQVIFGNFRGLKSEALFDQLMCSQKNLWKNFFCKYVEFKGNSKKLEEGFSVANLNSLIIVYEYIFQRLEYDASKFYSSELNIYVVVISIFSSHSGSSKRLIYMRFLPKLDKLLKFCAFYFPSKFMKTILVSLSAAPTDLLR